MTLDESSLEVIELLGWECREKLKEKPNAEMVFLHDFCLGTVLHRGEGGFAEFWNDAARQGRLK